MEFKVFAEILSRLEATSKRLEKIRIIEELLDITTTEDLESVLLLLEGRVYPIWSDKKLGIASKLAIKSIATTYGIKSETLENDFAKRGDLGLTAEKFAGSKNQQTLFSFGHEQETLMVSKVFKNFRKLAEIEGNGTVDLKIGLISELLNHATNIEAKYIIRIAIGDLRVGVSSGTIRDAVQNTVFPKILGLHDKKELDEHPKEAITIPDDFSNETLLWKKAIQCENYEKARELHNAIKDALQEAFDKLNESYKVVMIAKEKGYKGLKEVGLEVLVPIKAMLMQKVSSVKEATEKIPLPFALEFKYDGFRAQCHKKGNTIELHTRNLEEVTNQFPDIVELISKNIKDDVILDGEILGIDEHGKYLAFQNISQRIKRKHNIKELVEKIPVIYATWDILYLNGKSLIHLSQKERRKILIETVKSTESLKTSEQKIITNIKEGEKFYKESLEQGNEGVVVKDLNATYKPGNRVGCWLKLKPIMDPLDLVIVGAEWGEGKRAKWLTSFLIACKEGDEFLTIGKVGTGIKELEGEEGTTFEELTNLLKPLIISEKGKEVKIKPKIVIEIAYEEIQKSPTYTSGYALRFPRFKQIRNDVDINDVDDIEKVDTYYKEQ